MSEIMSEISEVAIVTDALTWPVAVGTIGVICIIGLIWAKINYNKVLDIEPESK